MTSTANPYENGWNLFKQMANEYLYDKKYITKKEIQYIIKTIDRSISVYNDFHKENSKETV